MKLSSKFAKAAGACLLGATLIAAAGCSQQPQTPAQQQAAAEQSNGVFADACVVVDNNPGYPYSTYKNTNTYDFRNGIVLLATFGNNGMIERETSAVPISQLNDSGKARAMEMYNKLPAAARCEAPKPAPK